MSLQQISVIFLLLVPPQTAQFHPRESTAVSRLHAQQPDLCWARYNINDKRRVSPQSHKSDHIPAALCLKGKQALLDSGPESPVKAQQRGSSLLPQPRLSGHPTPAAPRASARSLGGAGGPHSALHLSPSTEEFPTLGQVLGH